MELRLKPIMIGAVLAELTLLVGDFRVLVWQTHNRARDLGYGQDTLSCHYFNGRGFVGGNEGGDYWYSPNNIMGRDSCPFVKRGL